MVSIKVCWKKSGKPAEGRKVSVAFDGITRGITNNEYTDNNGEAHFNADPGRGKVYVDGSTAYNGMIEGRIVVYI